MSGPFRENSSSWSSSTIRFQSDFPTKILYESLPSNKSDFFSFFLESGVQSCKTCLSKRLLNVWGFLVYQSIWICIWFTYRPINEEYVYTKSQLAYRPHISLQLNNCQWLTSQSTCVYEPWVRVANTFAVIILSPFYVCFPLISKFFCHYCYCNSCLLWFNKGFSNFKWHLELR